MHEFEEIIFLPDWLQKNKNILADRFPKLSKYLVSKIDNISTSEFALVVFEEYILIILITISAVYFDFYNLWIGVFMAFYLHLIVHIIQWLVVRKYVPFIISSIICLPYCTYLLKILLTMKEIHYETLTFRTIIGIIVTLLNLIVVHHIAMLMTKKLLSTRPQFIF
ncbi:MAG: HXXEE domain-containing protein [Candidatus Peribacteria bacterium]|nr:HXXEE domain-containing protein [Candidatus Peribacteria bacterium]